MTTTTSIADDADVNNDACRRRWTLRRQNETTTLTTFNVDAPTLDVVDDIDLDDAALVATTTTLVNDATYQPRLPITASTTTFADAVDQHDATQDDVATTFDHALT